MTRQLEELMEPAAVTSVGFQGTEQLPSLAVRFASADEPRVLARLREVAQRLQAPIVGAQTLRGEAIWIDDPRLRAE